MDSDPLAGTVLDGRYRLDRAIGEGGMATVYLAEQLSMKREVAIKLIRPELTLEPAVVVRFGREVEAVSRLRSPHVIDFYDYGTSSEGTLYIAMERLRGRSLLEELQGTGPASFGTVISVARQVAAALAEAHHSGVTHRDLSAANIYLCDFPSPISPFVKVLDFGLAKLSEGVDGFIALTGTSNTVGTPDYLAPEAVVAGREADYRVDLYALGVVVFYMLVGRVPYPGRTAVEVAAAHVRNPIPSALELASHLPPEIDSFFDIALAKDPGARFQDATTLVDALATALGDRRRRI